MSDFGELSRVEGLSPQQFIAKWSRTGLPERAASQEHFLDLCRLLGQPTPAEHDATGAEYTFEKGVSVTGGASRGSRGEAGFADVWWRGKFGWEYKRQGKYRDLAEAYRQLLQYREALDNPPLLIVSDISRTEIHTNFTGTKKEVHTIALAELAEPENLAKLRRVFTEPDSFRPQLTTQRVTEQVAEQIGQIARALHARGHEPHAAAHFLMKCMFCLFAEDVRLLPAGVFKRLLERGRRDAERLTGLLTQLFTAMRTGGDFGTEEIAWFNGGLFDESAALDLRAAEIETMLAAAGQDWGAVEPAIFGTLFERSLDPNKRAQIGAHYTSRDDIMLIVEPVVMAPLKRAWEAVQTQAQALIERRDKAKTKETKRRHESDIARTIETFLDRLASVKILDPACGSGNFLYVAIQQLLELEKQVITFAARPDIALGLFPRVRPTQLRGIEINPYAAELAQVVIWIGYLQWMRDNGFLAPRDPILEPLTTVECRDAILAWEDEQGRPIPAQRDGATCTGLASWPEADFIIGNPPFLGGSKIRDGLGEAYAEALFRTYDGRLSAFSDLCCYWFELGKARIEHQPHCRIGLLATQGIRGETNRAVLEGIKETGDIFMAHSDEEWVLEGAHVHVSMIGFDDGSEEAKQLNGSPVQKINANLTSATDVTEASCLRENENLWAYGSQQKAPFDIPPSVARAMLADPNPSGRSNAETVMPSMNGAQVLGRRQPTYVVDFGLGTSMQEAASFAAPFEYVRTHIYPRRANHQEKCQRETWWLHARPSPKYRGFRASLQRIVVTPTLSKHRVFVWLAPQALVDHQTVVFGRSDDYFLGVLHSSIHELWARSLGTQLREAESGFRYTPSTCFETFPLPWPPGNEPERDPIHRLIAEAAKALNEQRERWLNPPEWLDPIAAAIDAADDFADVPAEARPLIRHSAIMAAAAQDARLKKRTLTNLYNERPTWLRIAHEQLDRAVLAAYAATDPEGGWQEEWAGVWTETGAGRPLPDAHPLAARRREVDERVLANLLHLNLTRPG